MVDPQSSVPTVLSIFLQFFLPSCGIAYRPGTKQVRLGTIHKWELSIIILLMWTLHQHGIFWENP